MKYIFVKKIIYLYIFFMILIFFKCQYNPNAPWTVIECDDGNIQGKDDKYCSNQRKIKATFLSLAGLFSNLSETTKSEQSQIDSPIFSISTGKYLGEQEITLTTKTDGASIYYTLDNSEPTQESIKYETPILISKYGTTQIKAISIKNGFYSERKKESYDISFIDLEDSFLNKKPDAYQPFELIASYPGDGFSFVYGMSICCNQLYSGACSGAAANLNSLNPLNYSLILEPTCLYKDYYLLIGLLKNGKRVSWEKQYNYQIKANESVAKPVFNKIDGTYNSDLSIIISSDTSNASLYYTMDGTTPSTSSSLYTNPLSISGDGANVTIKAIAVKSGMDSSVASANYKIKYNTVTKPEFILYKIPQENSRSYLKIFNNTENSIIYYTEDGSEPSPLSSKYNDLLLILSQEGICKSIQIKALAVKDGMISSETSSYSKQLGPCF